MTKGDVVEELARHYPILSRRDAEVVVNSIFKGMTEALAKGERIEVRGFGSFSVKQRRARKGYNPRSGTIIAVPAKKAPFFKVAKELRLRVAGQVPPAKGLAREKVGRKKNAKTGTQGVSNPTRSIGSAFNFSENLHPLQEKKPPELFRRPL